MDSNLCGYKKCQTIFLLVHVFQLSSGNVYEAGQLNLLCVLELMNHTLQLLKEERSRVAHAPKPQLSPKHLQEKCQQMARVLQNLHLIRYTLRISILGFSPMCRCFKFAEVYL